jgi:Domain of unknown function (DUF4292)
MMIHRFLILVISITGLLSSCHPAKNIQKSVVTKDTVDTIAVQLPSNHAKEDSVVFIKEMYKGILDNHINFTTFSGKMDVDYEDANGKKYNVNAHIRMYKDSVIWVLVTGTLGIEGLRAYITTDSVKLLNKQDKIYTVRSIAYLQEITALPLTLSTLQDLLLGNPVFLDSNITTYSTSGNTVSLLSSGAFFINLFTITQADKLVQNSKLDDLDKQRNISGYLTFGDYEIKKEMNFSTKRSINIVYKKNLNIKMDFKQYDFNEKLSFPFSVPKNYTKN